MILRCVLFSLLMFSQQSYAEEQQNKFCRIVSLSPAMTSMLDELGQTDHLVGVTRYCRLKSKDAQSIQIVGGAMDPDVEMVVALNPDLVLAGSLLPANISERLKKFGIRVENFRQDTLQQIVYQYIWLATQTGAEEEAQQAVSYAESQLKRLGSDEGRPSDTALLIFSEKIELVAGGDTYPTQVMRLAGLENVASALGQPWPTISHEWLLEQDPDYIILASHLPDAEMPKHRQRCISAWKDDAVLSELSAVKNERVLTVGGNRLGIPSMRVFSVIELLQSQLNEIAAGGN